MKAVLVINEMPDRCVACPFFEFINGEDPDDCRTHCIAKSGLINEYGAEVRPKWCPLKPLPEKKHGRLIDADAYLKKVCTYRETGCGSCRFQTVCPVDEPTIIEAEGETEWKQY